MLQHVIVRTSAVFLRCKNVNVKVCLEVDVRIVCRRRLKLRTLVGRCTTRVTMILHIDGEDKECERAILCFYGETDVNCL